MENSGYLVDSFTHVPTSRRRDMGPPALTSLLHPIVFDLPTFVLDQWKHPSLVGRLVDGEDRGERYFFSLVKYHWRTEMGEKSFFLIFCVYRRRRRCSIPKKPHMCWCVCYYEGTPKPFYAPSAGVLKTNQHVERFQPQFLQQEATLFFALLLFTNTKAYLKHDAHSKKGKRCARYNKN